jgi:hypothetical protein
MAMIAGVASDFNLKISDVWHRGGKARRVIGVAENPQSVLDEFVLAMPGQVHAPTQVRVLFDAVGWTPDRAWFEMIRHNLRRVDMPLLRAVVPARPIMADFLFHSAADSGTTIERQLKLVAGCPAARGPQRGVARLGDAGVGP